MDKVLIGNDLCSNNYIHVYIGHDLYKLCQSSLLQCVAGTFTPYSQDVIKCHIVKNVSQNSACQTYLCNPWLPWEPTEATTTKERLKFLKVLL